MTCVFGKLVVFCGLVMHPAALSAVNSRATSRTTHPHVCQIRKVSAFDVRCYFVVLVIFYHYKYFYQIKSILSLESNSFLRFKWKKYQIIREKHKQIMCSFILYILFVFKIINNVLMFFKGNG